MSFIQNKNTTYETFAFSVVHNNYSIQKNDVKNRKNVICWGNGKCAV